MATLLNSNTKSCAPAFAELHCLSNFTFQTGASHPHELVERAAELGYQALALTDECSVAGVVRAHQAIKDQQLTLKLIIGSSFYQAEHRFVALAPNHAAYQELCQLISRCRLQAEKGRYHFRWQELLHCDHLLLLWQPQHPNDAQPVYDALKSHYQQRLWLLAERTLDEYDAVRYDAILACAQQWQLPVTCANDVHMHHPQRQALQDCLTALRHHQSVAECRERLYSNAERHLRSIKKLYHLYPDELITNATDIAQRCHFSLDELSYQYPRDCLPKGRDAGEYLRELVQQGIAQRFPNGAKATTLATIEKELQLIALKQYEHYFLTIYDIVRFARSRDILCQGRGSAANSVVCYCLGITEVNPEEVQLLFERFISEKRHEPPDIDVDFESQRREEVIQYIYQTYGRERAALTATVISYRRKSAIRDIGKALGLDLLQLEKVMNNFGWRYRDGNWLDELFRASVDSHTRQRFQQLVAELLGFPRHLSQHVGGFVISRGALTTLVPIENASMPDRSVIQWDKDDLESLGLMKVDILSLGMLSALRRCLAYISPPDHPLTLADIPRDDADTYAMIQQADTVGVFQIESRAQMNMLPRLKPKNYYDLVIQIAIVRPGPIHGDMVHPYLKRRNNEERPDYPMDELKPILKRTLGIPLFQEQIIAFAMVAANFTAGEADQLRRAMASWKKKGHMHILQQRLQDNMLANGFKLDYIQRIQRQLEGFGEYGFPESHSASFALLAYASSWLKCHYPAEFCCALLNSQPMGFYSPAQLINDAKRHGVEVRPVDINHSVWEHTLEADGNQKALRLGLRLVSGLQQAVGEQLIQHRPPTGYLSVQHCLQHNALDSQQRQALASANAFAGLTQHRYQARWQVAEPQQNDLFSQLETPPSWPLDAPNEVENLLEDYHSLGLSLGRHPLEILREQGKLGNSLKACELIQQPHDSEGFVSGLVTCRQRPGTSAGVTFVTLEDETGSSNVVVWLSTAQQQLKTLVSARILQVYGRIEKDPGSGIVNVIAYKLIDQSHLLHGLSANSHDFH
ncbi:error-prone DNA polymerase [Bacterioplanes sanyensis]|uniref:Error-prone DNA polymerase n=1 Tax=Bacterioplanes sanyensis TaxID=1249553 RepID=A0A222FLQ9_9GAMM|nr:error-prone DNA polymerase [Bacterioplanes sanyensis]ASP39526.1 error-prone DNA polymerase [Bacterioplanes sanyensis]